MTAPGATLCDGHDFDVRVFVCRNNVMGTHVMLEAAKVHGVKRFIHVSTDEVYGEVVSRVSHCCCLPIVEGDDGFVNHFFPLARLQGGHYISTYQSLLRNQSCCRMPRQGLLSLIWFTRYDYSVK